MNKTATKSKPTKTAKKTAGKKSKDQKPLIAPNTVIKLTVPKDQATEAYKKALKKLAKQIKIDGFRKGNVPAKIAEENLNPQSVIEEALQLVVPKIYEEELKKSGKLPLTYPEFNPVSLEKGEAWVLEAHIAERPSINLKSYKSVAKKAQKTALVEIEKQVAEAKKAAKSSPKSDKKTDKNNKQAPEPSQAEKESFILQFIYKELVSEIKPEIQELLVKEEVKYDLDSLSHRLKQMNIPFEKFLEHRQMTFEQLTNELAAGALGRLQISFIIDEIAKSEKLAVEKKDLDAEFDKIKDPELKKKQVSDPRYIDMMSQTILRQKVADHLINLK